LAVTLAYRTALNKALGKKEVLELQQKECKASFTQLEKRSLAVEKAQTIIQQVAKETQEQLRFHIEDIVRTCIEAVFDDAYVFNLEYEVKRNKTEAMLRFYKNGKEIDILSSSGGGLTDSAALGLRLAVWSLGNSNNVIILDESLKFLSKGLQPRMGEVLKEISNTLGLQLISVSHSDALIESADKIIEVKQVNGVSKVEVKE